MASIFLSYAREDSSKAKALAGCLERAGHEVWWDRRIQGGSEFSGEIEQALRSADVVIVLWSEASIRSAWVRDEAAEGRDSGHLVPIILDDSAPPLGFRQLQSIPITGWSGRGNPPNWQEILDAVAARSGAKAKPADRPTTIAWTRKPMIIGLAALCALLLAIGAWWLLEGRSQAAEPPVLAVLPFSDLSPERDKAYFAEGVAEAILSVLAKEPGIRVVGRSTARQLQDAGPQAGKMRRELGITHILEGSARSVGDQLRMSVRLIDASDGQQLWAEEYQRRLDNIFAVQDEIGSAVAQRLKGSFASPLQAAQQVTSADAYTLYLAARAKMRDRRISSLQDALRMARQVIGADPNYAPAHALYAELVWLLSYEGYGTMSIERARELAAPHARRAIQLAPNSAEGHAAFGLVWTGEEALKSLSRAIELDPSRAELRVWLARAFEKEGRNAEGLEQLKAAAETDPLLGPAIWNYAWWLAASGRYDDAELIVKAFENRGGSRAVAAKIRSDIAGSYRGDYSESVRHLLLALQIDPQAPVATDSLAITYEKLGLYDEAAKLRTHLPIYTRLFYTGQIPRLTSQAKKDGTKVWSQADPWVAVNALALSRDSAAIGRLYDQHPDRAALCEISNPGEVQLVIDVATALKAGGRSVESSLLLSCLKKNLARHGRGDVRAAFLPGPALDLAWAQVHALEAREGAALQLLERAVTGGIRASYGRGLSELAVFDAYAGSPKYRAIDGRLKQLIARERADVLRMLATRPPPHRQAA